MHSKLKQKVWPLSLHKQLEQLPPKILHKCLGYQIKNNENIFNVSVNGVAGIIEIPQGFYVGTTLAEALQQRINQIEDTSGNVGGITVKYDSSTNKFTFTNGTTGRDSTIKVRGATKFGLDNVDLGVGSVPQIYNLKQATNAEGLALFVDASGNKVTTPPANLVEGYFPLYIDEGEFDV